MNCKKCHKEIPDNSVFCCFCGKKQEVTKRKKAKRAKGTGSILIDKRNSNNPYRAYTPSGRHGEGRKYLGSYKTLAQAQEALQRHKDNYITDYNTYTLSQMYEAWSKMHFEQLTKSGAQGYKTAYRYLDSLYTRKFREIKTVDFQRCIDECAEKYSRSQCEKVKQLCSQLCKFAMQNDIVDKNYAEFIKLPKKQKSEKKIFTKDELNLLWNNSDDTRVQLILIMCYTGFRIGEVCNILISNVNLTEKYVIAGKKTKAGIDRYVPIQSDILPFVRNLYFKAKGTKLIDMDVKTFRNNIFYSALADLGIIDQPIKNDKTGKYEYKNPRLTPHCTRHTFATLCVEAGIAPENLKKIIGHSKYETTADIYVHEHTDTLQADMTKLKR